MKRNLVVLLMALAVVVVFVGCSPEVKTYVVTFDCNGGTDTVTAQTIEEGKTATKPTTTPSHVGWGFLGWSTVKDDATTEFDFDKETIKSDITLYALWKTTYSIGETGPAGGYIFYDCDADNSSGNADGLVSTECGWRYLELGPEDLSYKNSSGTTKYAYLFGYYRTSPSGSNLTAGTKTAIGTGKANTEALVKAMGETTYIYPQDCTWTDPSTKGLYAAKACADYSITKDGIVYDDWFLPSKDELNLMYVNLFKQDLGSFFFCDCFWSSSEHSNNNAWLQYFYSGNQSYEDRDDDSYVRPCRSF